MPAPNLLTNLNIIQLPGSYPNVGNLYGLNTIVTDPNFGTTIVRLTDGSSGGTGTLYESMQTADDPSGYGIWNTDDTMIVCRNTSGVTYPFQFNPVTMQGTQLGNSGPYKINGAVTFSKVNPGILYNCPQGGTAVNQILFSLVGGVWTYQSTTPY